MKLSLTLVLVITLFGPHRSFAAELPTDVKLDNWAATAVARCLKEGALSVQKDQLFHGDDLVSSLEAATSLAKLAQSVRSGKWRAGSGKPVSAAGKKKIETTNWETKSITRYAFAAIISRYADFYVRGIKRPSPQSKALGKSVLIPVVKIPSDTSNPAFVSLDYLAKRHLIQPGSPLLNPSARTISGIEMSHIIRDLALGMVDQDTNLGLDEFGATPDNTFHKPKPKSKDLKFSPKPTI